MGYGIGVDLGTTFTAGAVCRDGGSPEIVTLGNRAAAVPSLVFLREDETIITGDAALRRGLAEPQRLAREVKRRLGDPTPLLLGGVPMSADSVLAKLLRSAIDAITRREGGAPDRVVVCHPANWGPYKLELLAQTCRLAGVENPAFISEPEAAAVHYSVLERLDIGATVAVYDLGGGTFDAAVLRKDDDGFEILGAPEGIERLGGVDFDEAVLAHVRDAIGDAFTDLDPKHPATLATLARLRQECVDAKEALSADTETSIPVTLPGLNTEVRITRAQFESMIRVPLMETISALRRALHSAAIEPEDLSAVLLVGGSSRIPMVAELVGAELRRPVAVDADPKHVVALGAARTAARRLVPASVIAPALDEVETFEAAPATPVVPSAPMVPVVPITVAPTPALPPVEPPTPVPPARAERHELTPPLWPTAPSHPPKVDRPHRTDRRRGPLVAAAVVALLAVIVIGFVAFKLSSDDNATPATDFAGWISPCPATGRAAVCITAITFEGNQLSADFITHDVTLAAGQPGASDLVANFFLADIQEDQAGNQTAVVGTARVWGPDAPFRGTNGAGQSGYSTSDISSQITALCVLVGDRNGRVAAGTGNCAELPPRP